MTRFAPQYLQAASYAASEDRRLIGALWPAPASVGCQVGASTGMVVTVAAGQVAVPTSNNTGTVLCSSDATETVTVSAAPPSGTNRIDLIVCQARGADVDGGANNDFLFVDVAGVPAATPVAPAVPPNAVALAQIAVAGGSAAIVAGNITDVRPRSLAVPPSGFAPVHFRVVHGAQSIPRVAWVDLTTYSAPTENIGGGSFAGGVYTIPAAGRYLISASALWAIPTTSGWVGVQMQVPVSGGSPVPQDIRGWSNPTGFNGSTGPVITERFLAAGEGVRVQLYNSHPTLAMSTFAGYLGLEVHRVE